MVNQKWYFEPVETAGETNSDAPANGKTYYFRVRHSGQYLDIMNSGTIAGSRGQAYYFNGRRQQQFYLESAESGYYYIHPVYAMGGAKEVVLAKSASGTPPTLCVAEKNTASKAQKFRFQAVTAGKTYQIICMDGNTSFEVKGAAYDPAADITFTAASTKKNKQWILELCGDRIESSMTYTGTRRQIATVTDSRGNKTVNTYDAKDRLLTQVKDANGGITKYTYDSKTDQLTGVSKTVKGKERKVSYAYNNDRLKSITHNGFTYGYTYDVYGNRTSVSAGGTVLEKTEYRGHNGLVNKEIFANGNEIRNQYDKNEQLIAQYLKAGTAAEKKLYENIYDNYGNVIAHKDLINGVTYEYQYDLIDRLIGVDTNEGLAMRTSYDEKNRVESLVQKAGTEDSGVRTGYVYGDVVKNQKPGLSYGLTIDGTQRVAYTYDDLGRITKRTVKLDGNKEFTTSYTYLSGNGKGRTTLLVESVKNGAGTLYYSYDKLGNISAIQEQQSGSSTNQQKVKYTYDELGQLVREDNVWMNKTILYTYDIGGNMTLRSEYAYTTGTVSGTPVNTVYTYRTSGWKDQLTKYGSQSITYDAVGNPLTYRDMTMTWQKGKELKTVNKGGTVSTYTYNQEGIRIRKKVGTTETKYYLNGSKIAAMTAGGERRHFLYDQAGHLFAMKVGAKLYYYVYNVQNDVIGLIDSTGAQVVSYQYNSWGKLLSMTDSSADKVGSKNPFRYREYYYDDETGLYYLDSRYYDPETGRFVNADETGLLRRAPKELIHKKLYAYCDNNPVVRKDKSGKFGDTILDIAFIAGDVASIMANPANVLGYAELAADVVGLVIPGVTGGGQIVRVVANSDNILDAAKLADKVVDSTKAFKSEKKLGTKIHHSYDPVKNVMDDTQKFVNKTIKTIDAKIPCLWRPDAVDVENHIIYELKPYNRRSYRRALRQTRRYAKKLGGDWKIVIDMYR